MLQITRPMKTPAWGVTLILERAARSRAIIKTLQSFAASFGFIIIAQNKPFTKINSSRADST